MDAEIQSQRGDRALGVERIRIRLLGRELPLTLRVEDAARLVGVGRSSMYATVRRGEFATLCINGRTVVLTVPLLQRMGLEAELLGVGGPGQAASRDRPG